MKATTWRAPPRGARAAGHVTGEGRGYANERGAACKGGGAMLMRCRAQRGAGLC